MKLPISLLVLAAIGQAANSELPSASKTTDVNKTNKRELYEGNYGQRNGLSFGSKFGPTPGIEYADHSRDDLSDKSIYGDRVPQISKISDVLTGQGPPFEVALANHLYSPVSVYQQRISSPTTFEVPPDVSQLGYPRQRPNKQSQQYSEQYEQKSQNPQNNGPKPGYQPDYSRKESKLLHLETAFPRLEPSFSTPAPLSQDFFIQNLPNIDSHLFPQFSYQHVEHIPLRYPDGTLQPMQYIKQSLVKVVPMQSESSNGEVRRDQDNQPTERPETVQISTEAPNQDYNNARPQQVLSYANVFQSQPYALSQQYLSVPQSNHNIQPQAQYQQVTAQETIPLHNEQLVRIQQDNEHQQYLDQHYFLTPETPQTELLEQEVQTTPQPDEEYHSTEVITAPVPTESDIIQSETVSTLEPLSEHPTTPKILVPEVSTTTVAPYTTHKSVSRMPLAPLRPLPGSKRLPQPRPFSNTLPTSRFTTFSPLPSFRRYPHLNTRHPTSPTFLTTITSTPQPDPTEIVSTQLLPSIAAVSRTPIIRIRHKPSYNQLQSTTPQPTPPDVTTLQILSKPTTTFQPSTTLEPVAQPSIQTKQPDTETQRLDYLPLSELPPRPQPGVIYHLQSQSLPSSTPQPEQLYPENFQIQPSPQPQLQVYPQPPPRLQSYREPVLIQPALQHHLQSFLPPEHNQLYQPPVFNLRPQYQPLSTPLPPLIPSERKSSQPQLQPRPDAQEPKKIIPLTQKSKDSKGGETYLPPRVIAWRPPQPFLHPQVYSQSHEVFIHPDFHNLAAPTFTSVQYFGKYAQSIFGHYH